MSVRILIVEDEELIARSVSFALRREGFETQEVSTGAAALEAADESPPDLVLLDLVLPGSIGGLEVCRQIREHSAVPIIVLTARADAMDKVVALDRGADDYVVKPFSLPELLARVRAHLRRAAPTAPDLVQFPGLVIDLARRRVVVDGREVHLTPTEFALLRLFADQAGRPMSLRAIIDVVWAGAPGTTVDTVRVHVSSLRRKIEPDPANPRYLVTEPWVGYRFIEEPV